MSQSNSKARSMAAEEQTSGPPQSCSTDYQASTEVAIGSSRPSYLQPPGKA